MNTALRRDIHSSHIVFPRHSLEVEKTAHWITPTYSFRGISNLEFEAYTTFIEQVLRTVLPQDLVIALSACKDPLLIEKKVFSLCESLPLLAWNNPDRAPCTLCVSLLCHSKFTHGVGRYLCDTLTRLLVPGNFLNISSGRSLEFNFISCPGQDLFFHQVLIDIDDDQQLVLVKSNQESIEKEIRLSILAVRHARNVIAVKKLSPEQKKAMIEENIVSVLSRQTRNLENNVFDQVQNFWLHVSAEDKIKQLQEQLSPYIKQRPKIFDRDIFHEIRLSLLLLNDKFTGMRELRHVSRLISYQYLFRKTLIRACMKSPEERHLKLKLIKLTLPTQTNQKNNVLGIIGAMNVLRENESLEERHIMEAISHCLPHVHKIENSVVIDRRSHDPTRIFYLEIEKNDGTEFTSSEMRELKKHLIQELKKRVENVLHPVLIPRNEEEIMRNICLLSQQLKYLNDLPQVIISFNTQTEQQLQFTVILLRILRDDDLPLIEIFSKLSTELKIEDLEVKQVGLLRKRYPKEANVFKVSLDKKQFLRKDNTIDLFKARQSVSLELDHIFKGIRDFNGGLLSKQQEVFQEFRSLIEDTSSDNDFLIENFFYSITPPLQQTLIMPSSLKFLFSLMQKALDADYKKDLFFLKAQFDPEQLLVMAASPFHSIKDELFSLMITLKIPTQDLSHTHVNASGITCLGYIYQNRDPQIRNSFYSTLQSCLRDWQMSLKS
jgi:hypothetical protein